MKSIVKTITNRPVYALVSLFGLALAFASVYIILINMFFLTGYDKTHEKGDRIFRLNGKLITAEAENYHAKLGPGIGPALLNQIPEIENIFRTYIEDNKKISVPNSDIEFTEKIYAADESIFDVFTLPLIAGSPQNALSKPESIVLSNSMAIKLFGSVDIIGKNINVENENFVVQGVMKDTPENSHHRMSIIKRTDEHYHNLDGIIEALGQEAHWMPACYTFILLKENCEISAVLNKFDGFYKKNMSKFGEKINTTFELIPISLYDLHFSRHFDFDENHGNYTYAYILFIVALFLIIIASINYLNLHSSVLLTKSKEIAIRKINGAKNKTILGALTLESGVIVGLAVILGLLLSKLILVNLNSYFLVHDISFPDWQSLMVVMLITLGIIGMIALKNKMFLLSMPESPVNIIQKNSQMKSSKLQFGVSRPLIVLQLAFSIILIISSFLMTKQVDFLLGSDLGFDKNNIMMIEVKDKSMQSDKIYTLKNKLVSNPKIASVAFSSHIPGESLFSFHFPVDKEGKALRVIAYDMQTEPDYFSLMNIKTLYGDISKYNERNEDVCAVINKSLMKKCGFTKDIVNKKVNGIEIIAIVDDIHFNSLHTSMLPTAYVFAKNENPHGYLNIKLNTSDLNTAIAEIKTTFHEFFPNAEFNKHFLDKTIENLYVNDIKQGQFIKAFSILSLIIACMGLFGISIILSKSKTKEIGIRKVNGASISDLIVMLNKDFGIWVALAFLLAAPVAWYTMNKWLDNFAYKTQISLWIFIASGISVLVVTLLTVSCHSWRAASQNPVEALRYE